MSHFVTNIFRLIWILYTSPILLILLILTSFGIDTPYKKGKTTPPLSFYIGTTIVATLFWLLFGERIWIELQAIPFDASIPLFP